MHTANFTDGIYLVDFEFHPVGGREGNPPLPVCMVVRGGRQAAPSDTGRLIYSA